MLTFIDFISILRDSNPGNHGPPYLGDGYVSRFRFLAFVFSVTRWTLLISVLLNRLLDSILVVETRSIREYQFGKSSYLFKQPVRMSPALPTNIFFKKQNFGVLGLSTVMESSPQTCNPVNST